MVRSFNGCNLIFFVFRYAPHSLLAVHLCPSPLKTLVEAVIQFVDASTTAGGDECEV